MDTPFCFTFCGCNHIKGVKTVELKSENGFHNQTCQPGFRSCLLAAIKEHQMNRNNARSHDGLAGFTS
jgi:hypothetical protein